MRRLQVKWLCNVKINQNIFHCEYGIMKLWTFFFVYTILKLLIMVFLAIDCMYDLLMIVEWIQFHRAEGTIKCENCRDQWIENSVRWC